MPSKTRHLTFRLPVDHARKLHTQAEALGFSPGHLARLWLVERLEDARQETLVEDLARLDTEVRALRADLQALHESFVLAVEVLLAHAGRCPETQAETWVRENLLHPPPPP